MVEFARFFQYLHSENSRSGPAGDFDSANGHDDQIIGYLRHAQREGQFYKLAGSVLGIGEDFQLATRREALGGDSGDY